MWSLLFLGKRVAQTHDDDDAVFIDDARWSEGCTSNKKHFPEFLCHDDSAEERLECGVDYWAGYKSSEQC